MSVKTIPFYTWNKKIKSPRNPRLSSLCTPHEYFNKQQTSHIIRPVSPFLVLYVFTVSNSACHLPFLLLAVEILIHDVCEFLSSPWIYPNFHSGWMFYRLLTSRGSLLHRYTNRLNYRERKHGFCLVFTHLYISLSQFILHGMDKETNALSKKVGGGGGSGGATVQFHTYKNW